MSDQIPANVLPPLNYAKMPLVPSKQMLAVIARGEFPEDWERGKRAQNALSSREIPFKTEYEIAYGQYERLLELGGTEPHSNIFLSYANENQALRNVLFKVRSVLEGVGHFDRQALIESINTGLRTARDEQPSEDK